MEPENQPSPRSLAARLQARARHQILRQEDPDRERIFVTGLSRTGTSSITRALTILGYRTLHWPPIVGLHGPDDIRLQWPWWLETYDAFTDVPVAAFYGELDRRFPNAKFIETHRDRVPWLRSCREHFSVPSVDEEARRLHHRVYGSDLFDEERFAAAHDRHGEAVRAYFRGRDNFLVYSVTAGEGWEPLCRFLGRPLPPVPFPFENAATYYRLTGAGQERLDVRIWELAAEESDAAADIARLAEHIGLAQDVMSQAMKPGSVLHARKWSYLFDALGIPLENGRDLEPAA
jgi:hypothetical protein